MSGIFVNVDLASEYRYRKPVTENCSSMIVISQSGESIDTLMAMREAKKSNLTTCAIVNVEQSTIDREADYSIYTKVGPEIGVASTKSFTSQLTVLLLLAIKISQKFNKLDLKEYSKMIKYMRILPITLSKLLKLNEDIIDISYTIKNAKNVLFLARGNLYPIALEGALKLKEISYIHAEGFAAGEMKHGPIALIEENLPVIMFLVSDGLEDKSISNLQEAISRGANTILISDKKCINKSQSITSKIVVPSFETDFNSIFSPIFMAIPAQLLAYHVARIRGTDVDQPRNLANQLLWNKFRKIYGSYRLYIKFNVVIETKQLSVKKLNPKRNSKLKLIKSLSDRRISDFLNSNKIKTFNGLTWTPKLVYMNRQKYLKRLKRLGDYKIINVKELIN